MATSNRLSFVDLLIFSAPKGESPYAYAANYIAHIMPDKPDWYYKQIIASGVLNACNLLLTLASFLVVRRRRKASGDLGSLWFFRKRFGHPSRVPYIMPNPLTMFLVWNTMFTLLMQPYTWLNYFAYKYPTRAVTSKMYFWYGFVFTFDGAGMWMSAFGTLYATLLPRVLLGQEQRVPFLLHPVLLNSLCFGLPVLLYAVQITTSTLSQIAWSRFVNIQFDLVEGLTELSGEWLASNGTAVDSTLRQAMSADGTKLLNASVDSKATFVRNAWATAAW
ncbi:hypothetical protein BDV93DRAFT_306783 [Ceratobasidium sp. AG-I]|nr:hypothetical protein BDV93DRAFT_306783 [Ceratobasidium sp. AG-I]